MQKRDALLLISIFSLLFISWGVAGHRTVADIAFNHLTPNARAAVHALLGDTSLADVSTWADEVRNTPAYRGTAPEHYLNVHLRPVRDSFVSDVTRMHQPNVYSAILKNAAILRSGCSTMPENAIALKFLVHFVGDIHQPMHVSRADDKGGNTIQVRFDGKGTNLHALWDDGLLRHKRADEAQLTAEYDKMSARQVREWQKAPVIEWSWESNLTAINLYLDVEKKGGANITEDYYQTWIPVLEGHIQRAGIRLAGLLNDIFKDGLPPSAESTPVAVASAQTAKDGPYCDLVYGGKYFDKSGMTLLNLGASYPHNTMTVVIYGKDRGKWAGDPLKLYDGKKICVTGKQLMFNGKPEIIASEPGQVVVE